MKVFYKYFAFPLTIAIVAGLLYLLDCTFTGFFVEGKTFLWMAFISWTVFFGAEMNERIRGLIGVIIGFCVAIIMMLITNSFTLNFWTISISCLLGILLMNFLVMYLDHTKNFWTNSITGVFTGIALTFSGFGAGFSPLNSACEAFTMLGILALYTVLGLIAGYVSITVSAKAKQKTEQLEGKPKTEKTDK